MNVTPETDAIPQYSPAKVSFRCQSQGDFVKLDPVCPRDQTKLFTARWEGNTLTFEETKPVESPDGGPNPFEVDRAKLHAMKRNDLMTEAAVRGVEWDKKASLATMIDRIVEAGAPKEPPEGTEAKGDE